ncbi:MAG: hypothetical protein QNJ40_06085 [Xanthomonadales bacterium]|nr:hypothetical protein [Xanthomonadales bacterium]
MTESTKPCCGSGAASGCQCGASCTCQQCGNECAGGPFERPRFFSGQLLVEEDLQLMSDYVAAKSRVHNRFLHGAGVVCGLQVMCHPCGGGKVIVQPGNALDCCGNDIYVPCPVELDINEMIDQLRIEKRGGYDCGDPCETDCDENPDDPNCAERNARKYCLYINYCEELEQPVAPYVGGDNCAVQVCEPTRIREGYRFELRCPEEDPKPDNVWDRIVDCIGDLTQADKAAEDGLAASTYGSRAVMANQMVLAGEPIRFEQADRDQLSKGIAELSKIGALGDPDEAITQQAKEGEVRGWLDTFQATAAAVIRYDLLDENTQGSLEEETPELAQQVDQARELVHAMAPGLSQVSALKLSSDRDRLVADTWLTQGVQWTDPNIGADLKASDQPLRYALNTPYSGELQQQFVKDLSRMRGWLLQQLERKQLFADCKLRNDVLSIKIPQGSEPDPNALADAAFQLVEALLRYLVDCICAALNPPCQPCEDSAVKLACLEVEDCEVLRICNLERTFVLSWPAMRYWIPFLSTIGDLFEEACCGFRLDLSRPRDSGGRETRFLRSQNYMAQTAPAYRHIEGQAQLPTLYKIAKVNEATVRSAINLGGNLSTAALGEVSVSPEILKTPEFAQGIGDIAVSTLVDRPVVRERLLGPTQAEIADLKRQVEGFEIDEEEVEQLIERRVEGKLRNIDRALDRRLTASSLSATKVVKDLKAQLQEQKKTNRLLENRLKKLETAGGKS